MTYQWCSAISEVAGRPGPSEMTISLPDALQSILEHRIRLSPQTLAMTWLSETFEREFSDVGPHRDPVHLDATSHHTHGRSQNLTPCIYAHLLFVTLNVGFHHVTPSHDQSVLHLDHASHHEWVFETAFLSYNDDVIVDAMCVWVVSGYNAPPSSLTCHLAKQVEWGVPFFPRLQLASIHTIERIWHDELRVSGLDTVCWLNHINIDADDIVDKKSWAELLVEVIRSPTPPESLSSHHWHLLDNLVVASRPDLDLESHDMEVMRSLEKAEDWERLGVSFAILRHVLRHTDIRVYGRY